MAEDIVSYLQSKGLHIKNAGAGNVHLSCFFCNEAEGKRGRLYINVDENAEIPGLFLCHLCGERGSLRKIKRHFGDPVSDEETSGARRADVLNAATAFYKAQLATRSDVQDYLENKRGLTKDTIESRLLGWGGRGLIAELSKQGFAVEEMRHTGLVVGSSGNLYEYLQDKIIIPYLASGNTVLLRGRAYSDNDKAKYVTPSGQKSRLYNIDAVWVDSDAKKTEDICITEGEFDCMVLEQEGYRAVGLPGAKAWKENWAEYFVGFRRINICFDADPTGVSGAEKVQAAIGPRAKIVEVPEGKDVSDFVVTEGGSIKDLISTAAGGLLVSVDEAYDEWQGLQGQQGFKFGIDYLDAFLAPGLLPGQLAIMLAKTGVGKTLSALNFMTMAAMGNPDAKFLFISLEQTRSDWFERARRIHAFYHLDLAPRDKHDLDRFNTELDKDTKAYWRPRLAMADKNRIREEELVGCIEDFEERFGQKPDLTIVDYLGYYANGYSGTDRYDRVSNAVMGLKSVAKDQRIVIYTPHQLNRGNKHGEEPSIDDARDSGAIEETGDFVFTLWSGDSRNAVEMKDRTCDINMRIGKSRHGGKGVLVRFKFGYLSLAMLPIDSKAQGLLVKEAAYQEQQKTWEGAIARHAGFIS